MKIQILILFLLVAFVACKKEKLSNEEMLAGKTEKTWRATKETNAQGDKDKLTRDEKREKITFSRNGNVRMGDGESSVSGLWSFNGSVLTMQFNGTTVSENFTVLELSDDEMRLQGGDGSELTMKPE